MADGAHSSTRRRRRPCSPLTGGLATTGWCWQLARPSQAQWSDKSYDEMALRRGGRGGGARGERQKPHENSVLGHSTGQRAVQQQQRRRQRLRDADRCCRECRARARAERRGGRRCERCERRERCDGCGRRGRREGVCGSAHRGDEREKRGESWALKFGRVGVGGGEAVPATVNPCPRPAW